VDFPDAFERPNYRFNYSYWFPWLKQEEDTIASWKSDGSLQMVLKENTLYAKNKGREHHIPITRIAHIDMQFKRLVLPIITGGIVAPLAMISLFSGVLDQWVAAGLLLTGGMLAYYGYTGAYQVQIIFTNSLRLTFFVDEDSKGVRDFLAKVKDRLFLAKRGFYQKEKPLTRWESVTT